nr:MAG TPA: putative Fe-S oxidoreductase [Caudoviricetes sp.]
MKSFMIRDLFIEITSLCAEKCVHCSSCAGTSITDNIPFSTLCSLVEQALPLGLKNLTLSGGEPLLHSDVIPFLKFLQEKQVSSNIYTCGVYIFKKKLEPIPDAMIQAFVSSSVKRVIFSLQGGSAHVHENVSGIPGSFEITRKSIDKVCEARIPVELHFVPMRLNVDDLDEVIRYASTKGIKKVSLLRLVPQGRCSEGLLLSYEQKQQLYERVTILRTQYPYIEIRTGTPFNCISLAGIYCTAAQNKLLISARGEIFPCEAFKFLRGTRPTIYKHTLEDVWENDRLLNDIRNMLSQKDSCTDCEFARLCRGGCHGQRLQANGSLTGGIDPDCIKLHKIFSDLSSNHFTKVKTKF